MKYTKLLLIALLLLALCALGFSACNEDPDDTATDPCETHTFAEDGWTHLLAPTCTEAGQKRATCTVCGKVVDEAIPATGHTAGEWKQITAPTCAKEGLKERRCTVCNVQTETEMVDTVAHTLSERIVTAPTCETPGLKQTYCTGCDYTMDHGLEIIDHILGIEGEVVQEPDCDSPGLRRYYCIMCEEYSEVLEYSAPTHSLDGGTVTTAASCAASGAMIKHCTLCSYTESVTIPATGHTRVRSAAVSATCTTAGTTAGYYCETCGITFSGRSPIPATGHTPGDWTVLSPASAGASGSIVRICGDCNQQISTDVITLQNGTVRSATPTQFSLQGCSLVYQKSTSSVSDLYTESIQRFADVLGDVTGISLSPVTSAASGKRILIGQTSYPQSTAALQAIKGQGYAIRVTEDAIVIVGSDDLMTISALHFFLDNYVRSSTSIASITADCFVAYDNAEAMRLASSSGNLFSYVLDADLDLSSNHPYHTSLNRVNSRDYPCVEMDNLVAWLAEKTGLATTAFPIITDTTPDTGYELLFGMTNRPESAAAFALLDANEFAIRVTNNKVVLVGHNHDGLQAAYNLFKTLYDANGSLPGGFSYIGTVNTGWVVDFPRPDGEGIHLTASQDNHNSSLQFYYTGNGVSAETYLAYCQALEAAGYVKVLPTNQIENSLFNTYVNYQKKITLYVAYNDYLHKEEYTTEAMRAWHVLSGVVSGDDYITGEKVSYTVEYPIPDYQKCIRVISAPLSAVTLPDAGLLTPNPSYTKVTETSITAIQYLASAIGMGYIIQLEDGRFIVIDGGNNNSASNTQSYGTERANVWDALVRLYTKTYGFAPSISRPVHIAAWYNTHAHGDHTNTFLSVLKDYGPYIKLDYILANLPGEKEVYPTKGDRGGLDDNDLNTIRNTYGVDFKYVKLHTGQVLYLANIKIEVLMTHEDVFPTPIDQYNDTNTVLRFFIGNQDSDTVTTVLWPGDSGLYQSRFLCAMYGDYLESDILQVAHHGNIGCEIAFYETVKARTLLWPNKASTYNSYVKYSNRTKQWPYCIDYHLTHNIEELQYIMLSALYDFTLPFTVDGPNYDAIYDLDTGNVLSQQLSTGTDVSISTTPIVKRFENE